MLNIFRKKINTDEYLELKKDLESLRISFEGLRIEFDLVLSKLKFKYKITKRDLSEKSETEGIKDCVLLPE